MAKSKKIEKSKDENLTEIKNIESSTAMLAKIYIGPTIAKYNLQENSTYIKKYPHNVNEAIKEYPLIKNLMLDIKDVKNKNQENYRILYKSLKEEIGGK